MAKNQWRSVYCYCRQFPQVRVVVTIGWVCSEQRCGGIVRVFDWCVLFVRLFVGDWPLRNVVLCL